MRSMEWKRLIGKIIHGSICLWLVMNKSSVFSAQRSTSFQILYCVLERWTRTHNQTLHGNKDWDGSKLRNTETYDRIDREPMEFEWNIFPGFTHVAAQSRSQRFTVEIEWDTRAFPQRRIIFMSMFNGISWGSKDNKKECESNAKVVSLYAKKFGAGQWSFLGPGSEKKWFSISADSPQGEWDKMAEKMMLTFAESGHPVFPCHESIVQRSAQKPRRWKIVDTLLCRIGND